jgi:hypothetical protein
MPDRMLVPYFVVSPHFSEGFHRLLDASLLDALVSSLVQSNEEVDTSADTACSLGTTHSSLHLIEDEANAAYIDVAYECVAVLL